MRSAFLKRWVDHDPKMVDFLWVTPFQMLRATALESISFKFKNKIVHDLYTYITLRYVQAYPPSSSVSAPLPLRLALKRKAKLVRRPRKLNVLISSTERNHNRKVFLLIQLSPVVSWLLILKSLFDPYLVSLTSQNCWLQGCNVIYGRSRNHESKNDLWNGLYTLIHRWYSWPLYL